MIVFLRPVTRDNLASVVALEPKPEQKGLVAANIESIAEAYVKPYLVPRAVYNEAGELVGFVMYTQTPDPDDPEGSHWIYRLMIAGQYQGNGYGRAAMEQVLAHYRSDSRCHRVRVSFEPHNEVARALYASLGFVETGDVLGDRNGTHEIVVELEVS